MFNDNTTTSKQLTYYANKLFNNFMGCFANGEFRHPRNKREYCAIINFDKPNGAGTHWVAVAKRNNGEMAYFDSYGTIPISLPDKTYYNDHRLQHLNSTACGYFCLLFLSQFMRGEPIVDCYYKYYDISDPLHNEHVIEIFINELQKKYLGLLI